MERARLAYVDIYGSAAATVTLTLSFYKNYELAPHTTRVVDLVPMSGKEKKVARVAVNATGTFHTMRVNESSSIPWSIDAIVPHFKPAGMIRGMDEPE